MSRYFNYIPTLFAVLTRNTYLSIYFFIVNLRSYRDEIKAKYTYMSIHIYKIRNFNNNNFNIISMKNKEHKRNMEEASFSSFNFSNII